MTEPLDVITIGRASVDLYGGQVGGRLAARQPLVKGFAIGRTIFGEAARAWMTGELGDTDAADEMARRFASLCSAWDKERGNGRASVAERAGGAA